MDRWPWQQDKRDIAHLESNVEKYRKLIEQYILHYDNAKRVSENKTNEFRTTWGHLLETQRKNNDKRFGKIDKQLAELEERMTKRRRGRMFGRGALVF